MTKISHFNSFWRFSVKPTDSTYQTYIHYWSAWPNGSFGTIKNFENFFCIFPILPSKNGLVLHPFFYFTHLMLSHHNKSRKLAQNWNFLSKTLILGREKARKGKIALQKWKNNYLSFHTVLVSLQSLAKYRRYEHFKNKTSKKIMFLVNKTRFFFQIIFFLAFRHYVVR